MTVGCPCIIVVGDDSMDLLEFWEDLPQYATDTIQLRLTTRT